MGLSSAAIRSLRFRNRPPTGRPLGQFAGIALAQLEPGYFTDFCWASRSSTISRRFWSIADTRYWPPAGLWTLRSKPRSSDRMLLRLWLAGLSGNWPELGLTKVTGYQIAAVALPNYPELQVIASLPETTVPSPLEPPRTGAQDIRRPGNGGSAVRGWLVRRQVAEQ